MNGKKKKSLPDFAAWGKECLERSEKDDASKLLAPEPALYVVATPIGNLGDITLRALWVLSQADAILCEDTRVSGGLLNMYGIKKPLISCHDHNEEARIADVLARLAQGQTLALVSDAGTPTISDPGFKLVRACREAGQTVVALPGANAALTALASAGLPTDRFLFVGFLPAKSAARRAALAEIENVRATLVFYESAQRLGKTLADLAAVLSGGRQAAVARELTKLYEEAQVATLDELSAHYESAETPKGEVVILVEGAALSGGATVTNADIDAALRTALKTMSVRDAATAVSAALGLKKKDVYQRALGLEQSNKQRHPVATFFSPSYTNDPMK